jgi:hypothetical protein
VFCDVQRHVHTGLRASRGAAQQRAVFDLKYLFRNLPGVLSPIDWESWGQSYPQPARAEDRSEVVGLVAAAEGDESAAIVVRWWARQPGGWFVVRGEHDCVRGCWWCSSWPWHPITTVPPTLACRRPGHTPTGRRLPDRARR